MHSDNIFLQGLGQTAKAKTYNSAIRQYQAWGGLLPSTSGKVEQYLVSQATKEKPLAASSLALHVAALRYWHTWHNFNDPTQSIRVRETLSGIRSKETRVPLSKRPLTSQEAIKVMRYVVSPSCCAKEKRDKAIVAAFIGTGYRRSMISSITFEMMSGLEKKELDIGIHLPRHKGGKPVYSVIPFSGNSFCLASVIKNYVNEVPLKSGSLFRAINKKGEFSQELTATSINRIAKQVFTQVGIQDEKLSSHSMRKTLVNLLFEQKQSIEVVMKQGGWSKGDTVRGAYLDSNHQVQASAINEMLDSLLALTYKP
jgi:integrase